jgi:hypothetical protein
LVFDAVLRGLGRKLTTGERYLPADRLLPLNLFPACKMHVMLACCRARSQGLKLAALLDPGPVDYTISGASGYGFAGGNKGELIQSGASSRVTLGFNTAWVNSASLNANFDLVVGAALASSGRPVGTVDELRDAFPVPANPKATDDRYFLDPARTDFCGLSTTPPVGRLIQTETIDFEGLHQVGQSPCPQLISTVRVRNTSSELARYTFTTGAGLQVDPPPFFLLIPGEEGARGVSFDCSTQDSFQSFVRVDAVGLESGKTEQRTFSVTMTIVR